MKKVAVYNIKGGVGKTTSCVNLACMLAKEGFSVLLWDLDPQGGSSYFFDLHNKNNTAQSRLFDGYISIYDVIQSTENYHIDVISNDSQYTDQFMNKASRLTAVHFLNYDLVDKVLGEIKDDYDICIIDCSPGRFLLHDNIFKTSDVILVPNVPAPLSVYCNNVLVKSLQENRSIQGKVFSFFNMVQTNKKLHQYFLKAIKKEKNTFSSFIPFYTEIESITFNKESIFHQLKQNKSVNNYRDLWNELCEKLQWVNLKVSNTKVFSINKRMHKPSNFNGERIFTEAVL